MIGAVDIGGTKIAVAAVTGTGEIRSRHEWPTMEYSARETVMRISSTLRDLVNSRGELSGVGVSCTGPVDPFTGVVGSVDLLPGWEGLPLCDAIASETGLSVAMENDADAAALGESAWGAARGASRFVYITLSTGIGGGAVFDGELYRGVAGSHPELGHQALDPSGPKCYCGAFGCWEVLASGPAMTKWAIEHWPAAEARPEGILDAATICAMARTGHRFASSVVRGEAVWIGIGLANIVTILSPDVIALGGGVMASADLFLETAREIVRTRCGLVPHDKVNITTATLGRDAALIGAARVWQLRNEKRSAISVS